MSMYGDKKTTSAIIPQPSSTYFFETMSLIDLELTKLARLDGQLWAHKVTLQCLGFMWVLRSELWSSRLCYKHFTNWAIILVPSPYLLSVLTPVLLWSQLEDNCVFYPRLKSGHLSGTELSKDRADCPSSSDHRCPWPKTLFIRWHQEWLEQILVTY